MTIVTTIDSICEWLNANVCPNIKLKKPPKDGTPTNAKYEYELVHPYAFPMYLPTKDKLPPKVKTAFPSICVQLQSGTDTTDNREMDISLGFGAWNPGIHPDDWIIPEGSTPPEDGNVLSNEVEGWRDLWNFVDYTVTAIEQTTYLGENVEVVQNEEIEFGPYKEQDSIISYYPHWFAYMNFKVRSNLLRNNQSLINLL